jgi:hypothetical protein
VGVLLAAAAAAFTPPVIWSGIPPAVPPVIPCPPTDVDLDIIPASAAGTQAPARQPLATDALGDVWEMEEVSCWRGTWLRRGKSDVFDAYWTNPDGERERAVLRMWLRGRKVIVARYHEAGKYCRYDGLIGADWSTVQGWYSCTWHRSPMQWHGRIVRLPAS